MSCTAASTCGVQMGGTRSKPHNRPMRRTRKQKRKGGGCGCGASLTGGYRPTKRNQKYLQLWKKGKSIGFTMLASLKAKGLVPRSNGTRRVSNKYR
jgi:hypothetical protein